MKKFRCTSWLGTEMESKGGLFTWESINKCWSELINEGKAEILATDMDTFGVNSIKIRSNTTGCVYLYQK